jgi:hypothetical protein
MYISFKGGRKGGSEQMQKVYKLRTSKKLNNKN